MEIETLDHVALWVGDRDAIADFVTSRLGMHVIERTDAFTLVGGDARRGKLTLFAAESPREPGALKHVGLRVSALDGAEEIALADGLRLRLVERPTDLDYDLDHVALCSRQPAKTAEQYLALGFAPAEPGPGGVPRVRAGSAFVEFHEGGQTAPERPLLNHLAVLVESADDQRAEAEERGLEIADFVDAPNTRALFLWGPERVKIEYVEHKPSFSLA